MTVPLPPPPNKTPIQQFPDTDELSWYVAPETVKQLLALVSAHWENPALADSYMNQALAIAGEDLDVLVSAASGLLRARLGEIEAAKEIAVQVGEIESRNEFGGNVVRDILAYPNGDDEADES